MLAAAALCAAALGCAAGTRLLSGQTVCRRGTQRPCYKIVYFHDASRRTSYAEAQRACRADGGHLVSIETAAEQRLMETFISSLLASDGDFWIGLRRKKEEEGEDNSTECGSFYSWSDGSSAKFRNWYVDEPSCGSEICVVMYHQPSAPPGVGGPYMFQWNDDRCNVKNNFICKYSREKPTDAPVEDPHRDVATKPLSPVLPGEPRKRGVNVTAVGAREPVQSLAYILVPSIAVVLLLLVITAISCFWLFVRRSSAGDAGCGFGNVRAGFCCFSISRRKERMDTSPKEEEEEDAWLSNPGGNSPSLDIYKVLNKQSEADLAGTRPGTKNSSFGRGEPGRAATDTSGCASESGFVTNDIYELCGHRVGRSKESTWVDNEIYGY